MHILPQQQLTLASSFVLLASLALGAGCSSGGSPASSGPPADGGGDDAAGDDASAGTTWADGMQITASTTIDADQIVTIAPGANITVSSGVTITVKGTLQASSAASHAKLGGTGWTGIVVASGGTLALDGVDLAGATTAITVQAKAAKATYDHGTISLAATPFYVNQDGALSTTGAKVTGTKGVTRIGGSFTASHLDYDSNGHEGITTLGPSAIYFIEDSRLHGNGPAGGDMVVAGAGAASIHVAYTEIRNVHCAFHFDSIDAFDLSFLDIHDNQWGAMLYGSSGAGPRTISSSNFTSNAAYAYETQNQNGPITVDGSYMNGTTSDPQGAVTVKNAKQSPVSGVGPRP